MLRLASDTNRRSCDGDRLLFDGASLIVVNGECVAQGSQFGTSDVEVITAVCDLEAVRAKRSSSSRNQQAVQAPAYRRIETEFSLSADVLDLSLSPTPARAVFYHRPEEEIAYGPAVRVDVGLTRAAKRLGGVPAAAVRRDRQLRHGGAGL